MQIVIDMDEELYKRIKKNCYIYEEEAEKVALSIIGGAKLPEGHGRLKDVDFFIQKVNADRSHSIYVYSWTANDVLKALDKSYAPTIIEADRSEEE